MANPSGSVTTVVKGGGGIFSKLLRIKWSYVLVVILFIQAIATGIHNGGGTTAILYSLGERFFNIFNSIQVDSQYIIDNGAKFNGIWDMISTYWSLFSNLWLVYLWVKLFTWLWGRYNDSQKLFSYFLSILTFVVLEILYLFAMSYSGAEFLIGYGFFDIIKSPYNAIVNLFKALVLVFSSSGFAEKVNNMSNFSNLNICTNPSGCVI